MKDEQRRKENQARKLLSWSKTKITILSALMMPGLSPSPAIHFLASFRLAEASKLKNLTFFLEVRHHEQT